MSNKLMKIGIISLLVIAMVFVMPVAATPPASGGDTCNGAGCVNGDVDNSVDNSVDTTNTANGNGIIVDGGVYNDIDYNNPLTLKNNNVNTNLNNNVNTNLNTNVNTNVNVLTQGQMQGQMQGQVQLQHQDQHQGQFQTQANVQTVNVNIPKGADGGILISNSNHAPTVTQLDVGESKVFSRLVYPGEVLTFDVNNGDVVSFKSSSDVAFYTIGNYFDDVIRVGSSEATPSYDPYFHKMVFGSVVPVDFTNYWTTKASMIAGIDAKQVVIDNRAPRNSYTHIEVTITGGVPQYAPAPEPTPVPLKPDVYPTDMYGHAITS